MKDSEYLKTTREELGLSANQMADRMGYAHRSQIYQIERGEKKLSNQARKLLECINKHES